MSRSGLVVPNIFANQGSGPTPVSQIDTNFSTGAGWLADSSNGYGYWLQDSGTANSYIVSYPSGLLPSSLTPGFWFVMNPLNANTGTSVVTVNSLPAASITNPSGLSLSGSEINANSPVMLMYTGTNFIICGICPLIKNLSGLTSNQTFNCSGYTSISISLAWSSGTNLATTLNNVSSGTPISLVIINNEASSQGFGIAMTNSSGVAMNVFGLTAGSSGGTGLVNLGPGIVIGSNSAIMLQGIALTNNVVLSH